MSNLRDRLKRIQESKKNILQGEIRGQPDDIPVMEGWEPCGFKVIKRKVILKSPFKSIKNLPEFIAVFVPDLAGKEISALENFLFFDLETTGLSGGAGTVAFLAAFGRFVSGSLQITQYLLLDYPGENDFLDNVLSELKTKDSVIVSYNGKSFDCQIIKTRCLMNRIKPPEFLHADLLHPARRLWKNIIQDCSQASVERNILGIERKDDIPGALAPEIWFEFLKTGKTDRLLGICDHNKFDIFGLAAILGAVLSIAKDPFGGKYQYDMERIALYWRQYIRRFDYLKIDTGIKTAGEKLMRLAAEKDQRRAVYVYSYDEIKKGNYDNAYRFVLRGLKLFEDFSIYHQKLLRRKERLEKKIKPQEK